MQRALRRCKAKFYDLDHCRCIAAGRRPTRLSGILQRLPEETPGVTEETHNRFSTIPRTSSYPGTRPTAATFELRPKGGNTGDIQIAPRRPKVAPTRPKRLRRPSKSAPRRSKTDQEAPKTASRHPESPPGRPKTFPIDCAHASFAWERFPLISHSRHLLGNVSHRSYPGGLWPLSRQWSPSVAFDAQSRSGRPVSCTGRVLACLRLWPSPPPPRVGRSRAVGVVWLAGWLVGWHSSGVWAPWGASWLVGWLGGW